MKCKQQNHKQTVWDAPPFGETMKENRRNDVQEKQSVMLLGLVP